MYQIKMASTRTDRVIVALEIIGTTLIVSFAFGILLFQLM
jgi:hypothetical protein